MSFNSSFAAARRAGKASFSYQGKLYHTRTKEEENHPSPPKRPDTAKPDPAAAGRNAANSATTRSVAEANKPRTTTASRTPTPPRRPADLGGKAASSAPTPPRRPSDLGKKSDPAASGRDAANSATSRSVAAANAPRTQNHPAPSSRGPASTASTNASAPARSTRTDTVGTPRSQRPSQAETKGRTPAANASARTAAMKDKVNGDQGGPKSIDVIERLRRLFQRK